MSTRLLIGWVALGLLAGCATTKDVRWKYGEDPAVIEILGDGFSETDLQLIARRMASALSDAPHFQKLERPPRIVVGNLANRSEERIDLESLADKIQVELFKTGRFEMLDPKARRQVVAEYEAHQGGSVESASLTVPGSRYNADYIITGLLASVAQQSGGDKMIYYKMSLVASELDSGVVRWAEEREIRKKVEIEGISPNTSTRLKVVGYGLSAASFATGTGLLIAGLAHARAATFEFEHYQCPSPTGDPNWECTRTVNIPERGPEPTLSWTGGGLMLAAPVLAILTAALVPEGNPALSSINWVPTREGGALVVGGSF